jgi:hypothetical protein
MFLSLGVSRLEMANRIVALKTIAKKPSIARYHCAATTDYREARA